MAASTPVCLRRAIALLLLTSACGADVQDTVAVVDLRPVDERLLRASMALRGVRPSLDEYAQVADDAGSLEGIVDDWLEGDEFGATVRDMHAEQFRLRSDLHELMPPVGLMASSDTYELFEAVNEGPLALVEDVVLEGRPYTEIVTSASLRTNEVGSVLWGVELEDGEEWAAYTPDDGRPAWGVLSDGAMWIRHPTNGNNYQRGRANVVAATLLCEDFLVRDIPLGSDIDLSDDEAVAKAVNNDEACVSCHQSLDPLAGYLWGFVGSFEFRDVLEVNSEDCVPLRELDLDPESYEGASLRTVRRAATQAAHCYPLEPYTGDVEVIVDDTTYALSDSWELLGLRAPGYFGLGSDPHDLGGYIAEDPRFATCAVQRFAGYLTQQDPEDVPLQTRAELLAAFEDSDLDARELAKAVVLHETFTATALPAGSEQELIGRQSVRPEQYARMLDELTGFRYETDLDDFGCADDDPGCNCGGDVSCAGVPNLALTDRVGFRSMAGGMDGYRVTMPTHTVTPTKLLVVARMAAEAAGYVVLQDFDSSSPRLLTRVDADTSDEETLRAQLVDLHLRILGERLAADSPEIDETYELLVAVAADSDAETAWKVVLTAMFQDGRVLAY